MNPFAILQALRQLPALIETANSLARGEGETPRWSLAYTNRSFWFAVVSFAATLAVAVGVPFPVPVDLAADTIYGVISAVMLLLSAYERIAGRTRAIWTPRQAEKAVQEAVAVDTNPQAVAKGDELTAALKRAMQ